MQATERVRTPTDVGEADEREWMSMRVTETADVSIEETDDGQTEITVPISSTTAHRSGSRMSESALESMASQLAEETVGLWDDHGLDEYGWPEYRRSDMYGWWVGGEVEDGVLMGTARLRDGDERSADLVDQLDQGMPVGFSVGYIPLEEDMVEADEGDFEGEEQRVIFDVDLLETSPVGIPDNPNAYADAPARVIAHSIVDAGIQLDRSASEAIGQGIANGLQHMTDDESDASDAGTDDGGDGGGEGAADGTEGETNEGDEPTDTSAFDEEEVQEILNVIGDNLQSALEDAADELLDGAAGDDDDDDDDEESEGDNPDDDDDDDEENSADLEELRARVDRIESESRASAGRKGMVAAAASGEDDDGEGEEASGSDNGPESAYEAFRGEK